MKISKSIFIVILAHISFIVSFTNAKGARFIPKPSVSIYKHRNIGHPATLARPSNTHSSSSSHSSNFRNHADPNLGQPLTLGHGGGGPDSWTIGGGHGGDMAQNRILTSPYAASLNPVLPEPNPNSLGTFSNKPTGHLSGHQRSGSGNKFIPGIVLTAPLLNGGIEGLGRQDKEQIFGSRKYSEDDLPDDAADEISNSNFQDANNIDEETDYFDPFLERAEYYRTLGIPRPDHARPVMYPNAQMNPETIPQQQKIEKSDEIKQTPFLVTTPEPTVVYESTRRAKPKKVAPTVKVASTDTFGAERRGQNEEVIQGVNEKKAGRLTLNQHSRQESDYRTYDSDNRRQDNGSHHDVYFIGLVAGVTIASIFGVVGTGYIVYKFQQHNKAAADVDYPAYGVVGPNIKEGRHHRSGSGGSDHSNHRSPVTCLSPVGDRKLAQNAEMFHYQHQKQQITNSTRASNGVKSARLQSTSDQDSDEENEEVDYIVYECPGLASTGEMEVKNPLFQDDSTPNSPMKTPIKTPTKKHGG